MFNSMSFDQREGSSTGRVTVSENKNDKKRNKATVEGMVEMSFVTSPFSKKMRRSCDTPETLVSHEGEVS